MVQTTNATTLNVPLKQVITIPRAESPNVLPTSASHARAHYCFNTSREKHCLLAQITKNILCASPINTNINRDLNLTPITLLPYFYLASKRKINIKDLKSITHKINVFAFNFCWDGALLYFFEYANRSLSLEDSEKSLD